MAGSGENKGWVEAELRKLDEVLAKWKARDTVLIEGHESVRQVGDPVKAVDHTTCPKCGARVTGDDNFCGACGRALRATCKSCGQVLPC